MARPVLGGLQLFSVWILVTVVPSFADEEDSEITTPEVTVLGTRQSGVPMTNVPGSITVVNEPEIKIQQLTAPRIEDVLGRTVPGFNPTNGGVRQIRGRTAQVFVNGVPVNEQLRASSGSDINLLLPEQLGGIEVARGANSAYGFGSPGGIIALSTPRAESKELELHSRLLYSVNPHHMSGSARATLYQSAAQIVDRLDYHLGIAAGYDGQEFDPDGRPSLGFSGPSALSNSKESVLGLDGSFGYDLGAGSELRLATTYHHTDFLEGYDIDGLGTYRGTPSSIVRFSPADDNRRRAVTANLTYEHPDVFGSAVKLELLASDVATRAFRVGPSSRTVRDEQTNEYQGFRSSMSTPLDHVRSGTLATYGVDLLRNRYFRPVHFADTGELQTFLSPDVTLETYAPYLQLEALLGSLHLSGGVRHEEYRGSVETAVGSGGIEGGDIRGFDLTLFNAGVVYHWRPELDVFGSFTQGAEITQLGRAARNAGKAELIDPQPAKSNQYEIGIRGDKSLFRYAISGFFTESDLLSALQCDGINPCTPLREPRRLWGIEANLDSRVSDQWGFGGVLTWYEGERKPQGTDEWRPIGSRDVPPLLLAAYVRYLPRDWWRNTLRIDYRGSRDRFGDSTAFDEGRVDRVTLAHFDAAFHTGKGTLQFGVRNLFNTHYFSIPAEAGNNGFTWIPEEGRRVTLAYGVKW
jgi:iron complex outermembrane receptor protein